MSDQKITKELNKIGKEEIAATLLAAIENTARAAMYREEWSPDDYDITVLQLIRLRELFM